LQGRVTLSSMSPSQLDVGVQGEAADLGAEGAGDDWSGEAGEGALALGGAAEHGGGVEIGEERFVVGGGGGVRLVVGEVAAAFEEAVDAAADGGGEVSDVGVGRRRCGQEVGSVVRGAARRRRRIFVPTRDSPLWPLPCS